MLDTYTIIGFIGALVLMVGFLMNQIGKWQTTDFEYDFINLIGAAVLLVYSWQIQSNPFIILFAVWTLFSVKDVVWDGLVNMKKGKVEKELKQELEKEIKEEDNTQEQ